MSIYTTVQKAANACGMTLCTSLLTVGALCFCEPGYASKCSSSSEASTQVLATHLVTKFWNDVKEQDVTAYSRLIAKRFQGLNTAGHYNKDEQIAGLQGLTVTAFTLNNLIAARYEDTLVISYDFLAEGSGIVSGPSIDIWHKKKCRWKLISHSYVPFQVI